MSKLKDLKKLKGRADEVATLLKSLSHPYRLLIACALVEDEKCVSEIERETGIPQPHLSRDLAKLRDLKLVKARKEAKNVYYTVADKRLEKLVTALCDSFGGSGVRK